MKLTNYKKRARNIKKMMIFLKNVNKNGRTDIPYIEVWTWKF